MNLILLLRYIFHVLLSLLVTWFYARALDGSVIGRYDGTCSLFTFSRSRAFSRMSFGAHSCVNCARQMTCARMRDMCENARECGLGMLARWKRETTRYRHQQHQHQPPHIAARRRMTAAIPGPIWIQCSPLRDKKRIHFV